MPKTLLTAAVVTLLFNACDEPPRKVQPQRSARPRVAAPVANRTPVAFDAGVSVAPVAVAPTPVDPVALAHEAPGVDHLARSLRLGQEGDVAGALAEARRAVFSSPNDEDALAAVAKFARKIGNATLCAEAFGRLAALRPSDAEPLVQQARAQHRAKDYAAARMTGQSALARDSGNPEAFQIVGKAQLSAGELTGAISSFEQVIALSPTHGWAHNNLGFAYLRANENRKAVEVLEKAAELLPHTAAVHNNLGVAYLRLGDVEEARGAFQVAMDLSPKYVKAKINAARVARVNLEEETEDELDSLMEEAHPTPDPVTP